MIQHVCRIWLIELFFLERIQERTNATRRAVKTFWNRFNRSCHFSTTVMTIKTMTTTSFFTTKGFVLLNKSKAFCTLHFNELVIFAGKWECIQLPWNMWLILYDLYRSFCTLRRLHSHVFTNALSIVLRLWGATTQHHTKTSRTLSCIILPRPVVAKVEWDGRLKTSMYDSYMSWYRYILYRTVYIFTAERHRSSRMVWWVYTVYTRGPMLWFTAAGYTSLWGHAMRSDVKWSHYKQIARFLSLDMRTVHTLQPYPADSCCASADKWQPECFSACDVFCIVLCLHLVAPISSGKPCRESVDE